MLLSQACVAVLMLVGDSDGRISAAEEEAFRNAHLQTLAGAAIIDRAHESAIMAFLLQEHRSEAFLQQQQERSVDEHLRTIHKASQIVRRKEARDVFLKYCKQMYQLAVSIAEASRSYWGLGAAVSDKEAAMLRRLKRLLLPLSQDAENRSG